MKIGAWGCAAFLAASSAFAGVSDEWKPEVVKGHMEKLAKWQLAHPKRHSKTDWTYGAFYTGMAAYGHIDPQGVGFESIREVGREKDWAPARRIQHADDQCIGQAYIEVGIYDNNPAAIEKSKAQLDKAMELYNPKISMKFGEEKEWHNRWSWVDALFMSPTVYTKLYGYTGNEEYLKFVDKEFKACYDYLYDSAADLFYRDSRYFDQKTPTGQKMFWSRGNGWAYAALPIILTDMPKDWKTRSFYENLFKKMSKSVKKAQSADGSWHPSMHDEKNPDIIDMSASMFMLYGLIWGVNNGYLSEKDYIPAIRKAWTAACGCINDEGALGWVQPIADKPFQYSANSTEVYGSGAFLLAGAELYKYLIKKEHPGLKVVTLTSKENSLQQNKELSVSLAGIKVSDPAKLRVFDARNGRVIPHTIVGGKNGKIVFHADMMAKATREFWIFESKTLPEATAKAQ